MLILLKFVPAGLAVIILLIIAYRTGYHDGKFATLINNLQSLNETREDCLNMMSACRGQYYSRSQHLDGDIINEP